MGGTGELVATLRRQLQRQNAKLSMQGQISSLEGTIRLRDATIAYERAQRVAAQRGLVPYVRALEQFNGWLRDHRGPLTKTELIAKLKELGLYNISVGYDPEEDPEVKAAIEAGAIPLLRAVS